MGQHVHHWHHNGCHHLRAIGEPACVCGQSELGLYCCFCDRADRGEYEKEEAELVAKRDPHTGPGQDQSS